jgi:hypothetical protein
MKVIRRWLRGVPGITRTSVNKGSVKLAITCGVLNRFLLKRTELIWMNQFTHWFAQLFVKNCKFRERN